MPPKRGLNRNVVQKKPTQSAALSDYLEKEEEAKAVQMSLGKEEVKPVQVKDPNPSKTINTSLPYVFENNKLIRNEKYVEPINVDSIPDKVALNLDKKEVTLPLYIQALQEGVDDKHRYVGSTYTQPLEFALNKEDWKMFRSVGWNYWRSGLYYDDDTGVLPEFDKGTKSACLRRLAAILFEVEILTKSARLDDKAFHRFIIMTLGLQSYKDQIAVFFSSIQSDLDIVAFFGRSQFHFTDILIHCSESLPSDGAYDYIKLYVEELRRWIGNLRLDREFGRVSGFKWKGNYWEVLKELSDAKQMLLLLSAERYASFKERRIGRPALSQLAAEITKLALEDRETSLLKAAEDCSLKLEEFMTKQLCEKDLEITSLKREVENLNQKWQRGLSNERRTTKQLETFELAGVKVADVVELRSRMEQKFNEAFKASLTVEEFGYLKSYVDRIHIMLKNMEMDCRISISDLFISSCSEENDGKHLPSVDELIDNDVFKASYIGDKSKDVFYVGDISLPALKNKDEVMDFRYIETFGQQCASIPQAVNSDIAIAYEYKKLSDPYKNHESYDPNKNLNIPPQSEREYTDLTKMSVLKDKDDHYFTALKEEKGKSVVAHTLRRREELYDKMKRMNFKVGEAIPLCITGYLNGRFKGKVFVSPRYMETNWFTKPYEVGHHLLSLKVFDETLKEIAPCQSCWKHGFVSIVGPTNIMTPDNWREFMLTVNCGSENHKAKEYHVVVTVHTISIPVQVSHFCFLKYSDPQPNTLVALYRYGTQVDDARYSPMDLIFKENLWFNSQQSEQLFRM